ncbi:MAG: glycosyltransferase family 39 protein, partial [Thermoproteota archaeon]|nr:glycosyltransferase family 39 protein [Thermoproteota archaeon]
MFSIYNTILRRKELLIVISILIIAAYLRFWDLGIVGFNNDEAVYSGQAATLAGHEEFKKHFSLTRAHPLLLQSIISIIYFFYGVSDVAARMVSAAFGTSTVLILYLTGRILYEKKVAIAAALVTAVIPYHVMVTRQAMVDVPLSFFFILTIFFIAKYINSKTAKSEISNHGSRIWLYAIGISCGLSFLSKEVGILTLLASIAFLTITRRLRFSQLAKLIITFTAVISPHFIFILSSSERTFTKFLYFNWQSSRPPNHGPDFYFDVLGMGLNYVLSILLIGSIIYSLKNRKDSNLLLLAFIIIPFAFFQLWPTKGFHYLVPLIPVMVLLTMSFILTSDWMKRLPYSRMVSVILIIVIILNTNNIVSFFGGKDPIYLAG